MTAGERRRHLLQLLPTGSAGAEVGVWTGDFSAALLQAVKPRKLHLIDPWLYMGDEAHRGALYGGRAARSQGDMDSIYDRVRGRFGDAIEEGAVEIHRASSSDAAGELDDESLDWVYIDGDHRYAAVQSDLEIYASKLRSGGLLTGDDYGRAGWWEDGVTGAVDDFVSATGWETEMIDRGQYVLRKP